MMSFERILCPVDFSDPSRRALNYAVALSAWYSAPLTVLHAVASVPVFEVAAPFGPLGTPPVMLKDRDEIEEQRAALRRFIGSAADAPSVDLVVEMADTCPEILRQAIDRKVDLIVMGTHGRSGVRHVLLGSVAEKIIRNASCPILVVPPHAAEIEGVGAAVFKRIVYATDFSKASTAALNHALALAQEADARLTLLHALEFPQALHDIALPRDVEVDRLHAAAEAEYLRRLRALIPAQARMYCHVATKVDEGKPVRAILAVAADEQADLIVMGVQGRGTVDLMVFGSNAHGVIREAPCPVLVVPVPRGA
jgi:nucleotide-binding universal stress UspA family protein